jgi:hypothetical protein
MASRFDVSKKLSEKNIIATEKIFEKEALLAKVHNLVKNVIIIMLF